MFEIGRLTRLNLGYTGEANSRPIEICVADWLADWPGAAIGLLLRRPGEDTFYPAQTSVENGVLKYTPTRADVELPGDGLAQIVLTDENDVELRSRVVRTCIEPSLPGSEAEAPEEPMRPFVDQVLEAAARAEAAADEAQTAVEYVAEDAERAVAAADNAEAAAKRAEEAAGMIGPGGGGTGTVTSVNGVQPDDAGNVEIDIPEPPTKLGELEDDAEHRLVSDTEKAAWDAKSNFSGKYEDLSGKPTIPTKLSEMAADATHRLVTDTEKSAWNAKSNFSGKYADLTGKPTIPNVPSWALQSTKPTYTAAEVGALPSTYTPPNQTAAQVGADPAGTASSKVSTHNADEEAHPAIRQLISDLSGRLSALADSDDTTLDQLSEIVAYIKSNKSLIDSITTGKVSTADIVNNLTSTATDKPLSAAQGKALKALIDAIVVPTKLSELAEDTTHRVVTDTEKTAWNAKSTFSGKYADLTGKPTKVSAFENDAGYLTEHQDISHLLPRNELKAELKKAAMDVSWLDGYDIPVLELTGDTTGISKENSVTLNYTCNDKDGTARTGSCTLKWQGSSSLAYAKKNYTIKLDTALEMVDGWGAQKKYCLKANFIDHSHARNIVSAQVWGWLVNSRKNKHATMVAAPNYGAIDGFPIAIVLNGEFHGLYTWNIPKDGWMYGMGSGTKEAIVCANTPATDTQFKGETAVDANGLELEFTTDESNTAWIASSLNQLINACIDSWGGDLDTTVAQYIDWESAIDYYLYTVMLDGQDMMCKNYLLATYDGTKWYFGAYDMDSTYGLQWDGKKFLRPNSGTSVMFVNYASDHRLMELILRYKTNALKARWKELRADLLSEGRLERQFENFAARIPSRLLDEDVRRWPSIPSSAVCDINQILRWLHLRLKIVDELVDNLPAQETPVEPEQPVEMVNQVPISTDTDGSIYNGTGYKDDARLSSSGGVSGTAQAGSVTTGFIPCTNTDVVRIKGAEWLGASVKYSGHYYLNGYNSAKSFVNGINEGSSSSYDVTGAAFSYDDATGVLTIDLSQTTLAPGQGSEATGMAYMRINAYGKGANLIVTINQAITE